MTEALCSAQDAPFPMPERTEALCSAPDKGLPCSARLRLTQAISESPIQDQKILALYFYEGLTFKEIGLVLDISEDTARQQLNEVYSRIHAQIQGGFKQ